MSSGTATDVSSAVEWAAAEAWLQCGERSRALELILRCGQHLQSVGLADDAADVYERALGAELLSRERGAVMHRLVAVLSAAGQWRRLSDVVKDYRSSLALGDAGRHTFGVHRIRATWHLSDAHLSSVALKALRRYSLSATAQPHVRAEAATLGVAIADNCCNGQELERFAAVLESVRGAPGVDTRVIAEALLIYHTSSGDLHEAVTRASELVASDRRNGDQVRLARTLRIVSVPLRRSGDFASAEVTAREAFEIARRVGAHAQALGAIEAVCYTLFDQERAHEVTPWIQLARQLSTQYGQRRLPIGLHVVAVRAAIELQHDLDWADVELLRADRHRPDPIARRRALLLSTETNAALRCDRVDGLPVLVTRLFAAFGLTCNWGGQDYCVWVLCSALQRLGELGRAQSLARGYVENQRRETFEAPARLRQLYE